MIKLELLFFSHFANFSNRWFYLKSLLLAQVNHFVERKKENLKIRLDVDKISNFQLD